MKDLNEWKIIAKKGMKGFEPMILVDYDQQLPSVVSKDPNQNLNHSECYLCPVKHTRGTLLSSLVC